MKNLFIASFLLFSFTVSAQVEKGTKNKRPEKVVKSFNEKPNTFKEKPNSKQSTSKVTRPSNVPEKEKAYNKEMVNPSSKVTRPSNVPEKEKAYKKEMASPTVTGKNSQVSSRAAKSTSTKKEEKINPSSTIITNSKVKPDTFTKKRT